MENRNIALKDPPHRGPGGGEPFGRPSSPPGKGTDAYAYAADTDVHLLDRLAILYRYRAVASSVFVLSTAAIMIQGYTAVQRYQAQAQVLIEDERSTALPGITSPENTFYEDPEPYYNTQYRILQGRDLARRVIRKLKLAEVPEFNGTATTPSTPAMIADQLQTRVKGLLGMVAGTPPAREAPKVDETSDESALVDAFLGQVGVIPVRGSRLVDVTFQSTDPKTAALVVNALVDEYIDQNFEVKMQATRNSLEFLETELASQQTKVEDTERALVEYRQKQNALSLDEKQNIVVSRLTQLSDAAVRARTGRLQKEAQYNQIKTSQASGTPADAIPVIAQNPQVQAARARVASLQSERLRLMERYGEKHPQVINVQTQLEDARRQFDIEVAKALQAVKNEYDTAALEEQSLARSLDAAKVDASDLSKVSIGYSVMEREADSHRQVYRALLQRENELRVASNSRSNNVRVVDHAEVPKSPLTPTGRRTWLLSIAIGLVLAVGVAYGLDYMNDTIKTPEDVTRRLKLSFLGLVPSVRGNRHPLLASSQVPHDFGEAFRSLRTSLISKCGGSGACTILVTSAQPLEGKTTIAANVALALAFSGARVLLVDADMRRPGLHRPLRLTNDRGLSQVLKGQARVRDVIQRTVDPNLLAITAGPMPPNPSELLSSERMKTLLTNLAHGPFDWIVIDTPPVLAVTDAVILAPLVTAVTMVVGAEMTRRRLVERAVETIMSSPPKSLSLVLNKVDFARNKYYYSRYYGQHYKNYYSQAAV